MRICSDAPVAPNSLNYESLRPHFTADAELLRASPEQSEPPNLNAIEQLAAGLRHAPDSDPADSKRYPAFPFLREKVGG
jgi:hypothetical protein